MTTTKELFEELTKIHEKFSDILSLDITFQLRKIGQYGVDEWQNITENDAKKMNLTNILSFPLSDSSSP